MRPPPWPIITVSRLDHGKQPHLTSHSPICAASLHGNCDCHAEVVTTLFFRYCHSSLSHTEQNTCTGPKAPVTPASNAARPCTFLGSTSHVLHPRAPQFPLWDLWRALLRLTLKPHTSFPLLTLFALCAFYLLAWWFCFSVRG